ncbi:MAG: phosphate ABC transporter permease PstA [Pseudomonadota bacterium]
MTATIDMTAMSAKHTSADAERRTRRRHWAEFRLKAYGIIAILLAAAALVTLITTIVAKTTTVLTESYLSIDTVIEVNERNLEKLNDPDPRVNVALNGVVRDAMLSAIDGEVERREARSLFNLLSTDAGLELGALVKADRTLIGEDVRFDALLDDQVQMYLKGEFGTLADAGSEGTVELSVSEEDPARVFLDFDPRAMSEARLAMRDARAAQARRERAESRRQAAAVAFTRDQMANASSEEREALEAQLASFEAARDEANRKADALLAKVNPDADYTLSEDDPSVLIRANGGWIKLDRLTRERGEGVIVEPLDSMDAATEGTWRGGLFTRPENARNISDRQIIWLDNFDRQGKITEKPNWRLLTKSDSSNAELAGIWGALVGSFWTMIVTFLLAFPIGVMAAIYLEEFAPKSKLIDFIEININNLAAVPSIVFGLLGITVLISGVKLFGVELFDGLLRSITEDPRSTPLAGGVVLALMSLPTIIIAARASIKAVPPSIRDAALGIGASKLQTSTHHVLPLAMPGILTGSIIAMAQALGETAPLIIIGMNSFIQEAPGTPLDKGNVLPSLIYLWNNNSERLFDGKTAAAISVLLIFLIAMNALAVLLRRQFERRW